jgi:hypothetical protein
MRLTRERRLLLGGFVSIVFLLSGSRIVASLWKWHSGLLGSFEANRSELGKARQRIRAIPALRRVLEQRTTNLRSLSGGFMLPDSTEPGELLDSIVADAAQHSDVSLTTSEVRSDSTNMPSLHRFVLRAEGEANVRSLHNFLASLCLDTPRLSVRSLSIAREQPDLTDSLPETLRFEIYVEALASDREVGGSQ